MTQYSLKNEQNLSKAETRDTLLEHSLALVSKHEGKDFQVNDLPGLGFIFIKKLVDLLPDNKHVFYYGFERSEKNARIAYAHKPPSKRDKSCIDYYHPTTWFYTKRGKIEEYPYKKMTVRECQFKYATPDFSWRDKLIINLADYCGMTEHEIDDYINAINARPNEKSINFNFHTYNYINLYLTGRRGGGKYLPEKSTGNIKDKGQFIINKIKEKIDPNISKLVYEHYYVNNRGSYLSLSFESTNRKHFLTGEIPKIREVTEEMKKTKKNPIMVTAGFKADATRKANSQRAKNRARALKAWETIRANKRNQS